MDTNNANKKNKVKDVYEIARKEGFAEVEYKNSEFYVKLKRRQPTTGKKELSRLVQEIPRDTAGTLKIPLNSVKAPINGTFYRSPSPHHPPFVQEGDVVEQGAVLCIIEAMKVMNEIRSESKMKITKILVENGKNVVEGQDIFVVEFSVS